MNWIVNVQKFGIFDHSANPLLVAPGISCSCAPVSLSTRMLPGCGSQLKMGPCKVKPAAVAGDMIHSYPFHFLITIDWTHIRSMQTTCEYCTYFAEVSCVFPFSSMTNIAHKSCESITHLFPFRDYTNFWKLKMQDSLSPCFSKVATIQQDILPYTIIKGSLVGETSVLRTFRLSGKELVKERVSQRKS